MRCMARNKVPFWYALYQGNVPIKNDQGYETGESEVLYSKPQLFRANISSATGDSEIELFGKDLQYDKRIVLDDTAPAIDEYSILWVDEMPVLEADGTTRTPHDYVVEKVAPSLNSNVVAIRKVSVSGPNRH